MGADDAQLTMLQEVEVLQDKGMTDENWGQTENGLTEEDDGTGSYVKASTLGMFAGTMLSNHILHIIFLSHRPILQSNWNGEKFA